MKSKNSYASHYEAFSDSCRVLSLRTKYYPKNAGVKRLQSVFFPFFSFDVIRMLRLEDM